MSKLIWFLVVGYLICGLLVCMVALTELLEEHSDNEDFPLLKKAFFTVRAFAFFLFCSPAYAAWFTLCFIKDNIVDWYRKKKSNAIGN